MSETNGDWLIQLPVKSGIENGLKKRNFSHMFDQIFLAEVVGFIPAGSIEDFRVTSCISLKR